MGNLTKMENNDNLFHLNYLQQYLHAFKVHAKIFLQYCHTFFMMTLYLKQIFEAVGLSRFQMC